MELFNQLIKSSANWIRFELGLIELDGSDYYKEMHYRAKSIFKFLFNNSDTICISRVEGPGVVPAAPFCGANGAG